MAKGKELIEIKRKEFQASDNVKWVFRIVDADGVAFFDMRQWVHFKGKEDFGPTKKGAFIRADYFKEKLLPEIVSFLPK